MGKPGVFKRINDRDKTITPFKVYKSWTFTSLNQLTGSNIDRLTAIKPNPDKYSGNKATISASWEMRSDSASLFINYANGKPASLIWYSLDHLYYKRAGRPSETFGYADPASIQRNLYNEASVLSVPQVRFGESIKPGSVIWRMQNARLNAQSMSLVDDGKGNLIDTALSSSISHELLYLNFNTSTYNDNWTANSSSAVTDRNTIDSFQIRSDIPELTVTGKNVWLTSAEALPYSILATFLTPTTGSWGNGAKFHGNSYIRIPNFDELNFKQSNDFAVAFWIKRDTSDTSQYILTKRTTGTGNTLQQGLINTGDVQFNESQYPFEILIDTDGVLTSKISTGTSVTTLKPTDVTNTATGLFAGQRKHVLVQKTGSDFQMYVNGTLVNSGPVPAGNFHNKADIFIGSLGLDSNKNGVSGFSGSVNEFFMFGKALTQSEITQLTFTGSENLMTTNTNIVGNVFYEHGMIVLSDPRPKYGTPEYRMFADQTYTIIDPDLQIPILPSSNLRNIYLEYNSTVTIYEHEYICKMKEDEFNFTTNPTIRLDNNEQSGVPKSFVSNDEFGPYITTVGLYDTYGQLLAIGKLGTPIKKRDDVDLNIIVRFDI